MIHINLTINHNSLQHKDILFELSCTNISDRAVIVSIYYWVSQLSSFSIYLKKAQYMHFEVIIPLLIS